MTMLFLILIAPKTEKKSSIDEEGPVEIVCPDLDSKPGPKKFLLKTITLQNDLGVMKLRSFPLVLRMHKFKESKNPHEFFYSELLLYKHWRSEDELREDSFDECLKLFNMSSPNDPNQTYIFEVKERLFPQKNNVELARAIIEELDDQDQRPSHIGDQLDAQNEQENEDNETIGTSVNPDHQFRSYDNDLRDGSEQKSMFKTADLSDYNQMLEDVRKLVPEQRQIFDKLIGYAKELRKHKASSLKVNNPPPKAPLLVVQGGAGSGKSKLIESIYQWFEKWMICNEDRFIEQPYALKLAPTGMASHKIRGYTMHSALRLPFNNSMESLTPQNRENLRKTLCRLELLIIDEMSMVKSDQLYQIHKNLQDIKQSNNVFGGVAVVLFGDLMQLKPIKGRWIFEAPSGPAKNAHELVSLWKEMEPHTLEENHRQKNDKTFADLLNRIRMGEKTEEDVKILNTRIVKNLAKDAPSDTLMIFCTRDEVHAQNNFKMGQLDAHPKSFKAVHHCSTRTRYSPPIDPNDGTVGNTRYV